MWDKLFIKSETLFYNINNILCTNITLKESAMIYYEQIVNWTK